MDLTQLGNGMDQFSGILPAKAGIRDGFSVNMVGTDFLVSFFDITFHHHAFDQAGDIRRMAPAVKHFLDDADLFPELFVGIGVIGVHDGGGVFQIPFIIFFQKQLQIFIMVVGDGVAVFVHRAP